MSATHQVLNQVPPLVDYDAAAIDVPLQDSLRRFGGDPLATSMTPIGVKTGSAEAQLWARQANEVPPILRTHDRYGNRISEVEFHPAWHSLMNVAVEGGFHGAPWASGDEHAHVRRAAGFYVWSQNEAGHGCPISMTYAIVPALRNNELSRALVPGLTATTYQPIARASGLSRNGGMSLPKTGM